MSTPFRDDVIIEEIRGLGLPSCLLDTDILTAVRWVIREIRDLYPVMAVGYFTLVACQRIYDLFNPVRDDATSQGLFPGGQRVFEVLLAGDSLGGGTDVFGIAPYLQGTGGFFPMLGGPSRYSFNTPGDWVIWDQDWAALAHRFNPGRFEQLTDLDGAPLRIFSNISDASCPAFLRFTRPRSDAEIRAENQSAFLTLVEARCCDTVANKFYLAAGVTFGEVLRDDGRTASHFELEAKRKYEQGWARFDALRNEQVAAVERSHGP